jgi:hypothetical protein
MTIPIEKMIERRRREKEATKEKRAKDSYRL